MIEAQLSASGPDSGQRPTLAPAGLVQIRREPFAHALAFGTTTFVHVFVVVAITLAGRHQPEAEEPPQHLMAEFVELPRIGKVLDPKALPRIVAVPTPEPPPAAPVNLNQEREEEPVLDQKKVADAQERLREDDAREDEKKRLDDDRKNRQKAMQKALEEVEDIRADEDAPEGLPDGFALGTSTKAAQVRDLALWQAEVSAKLREQLTVPAGISPGECKKLQALLTLVLDRGGHVKNKVEILDTSGNLFFDDSAIRAVRHFNLEDGTLILPLPNEKTLKDVRKVVTSLGFEATIRCQP